MATIKRWATLAVVFATGCAVAACNSSNDEATDTVSTTPNSTESPSTYWSEERMQSAEPAEMPTDE